MSGFDLFFSLEKTGVLMTEAMIVITDCNHANIDEEKAVFEAAGVPYTLCQCKTEDDLIANCQGAVSVCNQRAPFTERVFAALPRLKMIVRYGDGVDNVDLEAATRHGVQVCNVPDYGTSEVANHALALMLAITRKICQANDQVRAGRWNYAEMAPIQHLANMTVGIIGLGRIGLAFAKRVHALGCRVIGFDIFTDHVKGDPDCSFIELTSEADVISRADVLSLHCSLNAQDARMMNAESFSRMKQGALFVNVTRGGLVEEEALAAALKSGHLAGAGVDVTGKEPLPMDSPLRSAPNLVITPHMAWYSVQAESNLKTRCAEEAVRGFRGEKPRCPVNKL